jgi:hypothetical protein
VRSPSFLYAVLALPFALVAWGANAAADRVAGIAAASLAGLGHWASGPASAPEPAAGQELALAPVDVVSGDAPRSAPLADVQAEKRAKRRSVPRVVVARAVRVPRETVLRLANSGTRLRGVPVKAEGLRPAGILLSGVSALGIGLQDGDVLVEAVNRPALDVGGVVAAVIAARSARVPELTGRFWRHGELWLLVVEQPY